MSYWVLTVFGHAISCVTAQRLTNPEINTNEWSQRIIEYNIAIEQRIDVKDADLSKELIMVDHQETQNVADEDPEFLDEYNRVISDGSIPNGEDDNETDDKEQEDIYFNMELWLPRKYDDGLTHTILKRRNMDDEVKAVGNMNNNPLLDTIAYKIAFAEGMTEVLTAKNIFNNTLPKLMRNYTVKCF